LDRCAILAQCKHAGLPDSRTSAGAEQVWDNELRWP